jgi:transposase
MNSGALEQIRMMAVKRVIENHEGPESVIRSYGMNRRIIYEWLNKYKVGGYDALKNKPGKGGRTCKLEGFENLHKLYCIIRDATPEYYGYETALWTSDIVRVVIEKEFNIKMSQSSAKRMLHKIGMTPQKPKRKAFQQDTVAVEKFVKEDYPAIKKQALQEKADVFWGDEASIRSDYHSGTTWSPVGETPTVATTGARYSVNMISAISKNGSMRFMVCEKTCTAEVFIGFLKRLIKWRRRNLFLIVDGHPVHKSKLVKEFVESTKGKLKLFFLPGYSPELNPDELVWAQTKHHIIGKATITGIDQFRTLVKNTLQSVAKVSNTISAFFQKPALQFI